jgi:two-component system response regulator NreC
VLADDHEIVRNGVRMVLESEPDIDVVAEAGDADTAVRYVRGHQPSVLVLDLSMPGKPSLDAIGEVVDASPATRIVVLTMQNEPTFARRALKTGAHGYVIKQAAATELVGAVRAVVAGDTYINPSLGARLATTDGERAPNDLTPRELEVLRLLALGYMNPEIADRLVLSVRTVETHRANLQRKTAVTTRAELIAYALEHGLVER